MANFAFTHFKEKLGNAEIDFAAPDNFEILLLTVITDAEAGRDDEFVGTFLGRTITELGVGGYSRHSLTGDTLTRDDANNRAEIDWTDPVFASLASGATIVGFVIFKVVTNDADSPLIAFFDTDSAGAISIATNGSDVTIQINAQGLLQIT